MDASFRFLRGAFSHRHVVFCLAVAFLGGVFTFGRMSTCHAESPFQEIYDAGLTKYVGTSIVQPTSVTKDKLTGIQTHYFSSTSSERGPMCMSGSKFFVETRDGSSDQLLIFLEGGGVCLSEICQATAYAMLSLKNITYTNLIGIGGILNKYDWRNPMAHFDVVHVPYCDGTIFMGDIDRPLVYDLFSREPKMAYQRGLQNLTAAFEVAKQRYPNPSRIVLAGTSGGAYGIVAGLAMARYYYPDKEILVIADSGAPMLRDQDKDFVRRALEDINAIQYVPFASCPDCIDNGHVSKIIAWGLERDENFRVALMSHIDDFVIGDFFMKSPPPIFREALLHEYAYLKNQSENRVSRFVTLGRGHTYLLNAAAMDFILDMVGGLYTGDYDLPDLKAMKTDLKGGLAQVHTDVMGRTVTGYQWLYNFLNVPNKLDDVMDLE